MKPYQTQPLGSAQPENKHAQHELKITLRGNDGSSWSTEFQFDTRSAAPRRFIILELPGKVKNPTGQMIQLSETRSEFVVDLLGPASPATIKDLSAMPLKDWMATLYISFAETQSAVGVLVTHGRVSVTLHGGE